MELSHQMLLIADFLRKLFFEHYLVSEIGTELSKKLEYKYPDKLENDIRKYLAGLKPKT